MMCAYPEEHAKMLERDFVFNSANSSVSREWGRELGYGMLMTSHSGGPFWLHGHKCFVMPPSSDFNQGENNAAISLQIYLGLREQL